jgi:penicillin-binding protein 2
MPDTSRVRVSIVGVVVTALFCSLLARLWFLQVRDSTTSVQLTSEAVRTVEVDSPRGSIVDSNGTVIAGNRVVWTVIADPALRSASHTSTLRKQMVPKLAKLLHETPAQVTHALDDKRDGPLQSAVIAENVSPVVQTELAEGAHEYPHVALQAIYERAYPIPTLAPQVLGYTGLIDEADLKRHPNYDRNDTIGRAGIEQVYDADLRGTPSTVEVNVNPAGAVVGKPVRTLPGKPGHNVQLSIDGSVQQSVQQSLAAGIAVAQTQQNEDAKGFTDKYAAPAGSAVVLDTTNGNVVAMASYPTYPNSSDLGTQYADLMQPSKHDPLLNRATQGLYAPGSTFKLITAQAAVKTGTRRITQTIDDNGVYYANSRDHQRFQSAGDEGTGTVDLQTAITRSSDVYFYGIGDALYDRWAAGDKQAGYAIQDTARDFGFGSKTSIDLDEAQGVVPDAAWRKAFVAREAQLGVAPYKSMSASELAGFETWRPGDNILLGVGQGDLLVTPLQLADAYAAFANGGTLWRPRLVTKIVDPSNGKSQRVAPTALRHETIAPDLRQAMLAGFQGVVSDPKGTATQAFQGFPVAEFNVAGKTGTAQVGQPSNGNCVVVVNGAPDFKNCIGDTSWFVGMFGGTDAQHPRYVVVVNVEQGGRGGRIAAPIARNIIAKMTGQPIVQIPDLTPAQGGHR